MKKLFGIVAFMFILNSMLQAQEFNKALESFHSEFLRREASGELDPSIQGSPFLYDEFDKATVYMHSMEPVQTDIRLDVCNNAFQIKKNGTILELTTDLLDSIVWKGATYVMFDHNGQKVPVELVKQIDNQFFYVHHVTVFEEAVEAKGYQDPSPAQFVKQDPEYIFVLKDKEPIIVDRISKLSNEFPERKDELKKFIKKNKIKKNKKDKLILLFQFLAQ